MFCTNCGTQQSDGTTFCTNCGESLNQTVSYNQGNTDQGSYTQGNYTQGGYTQDSVSKPVYKQWWFWTIIAIVSFIVIIVIIVNSTQRTGSRMLMEPSIETNQYDNFDVNTNIDTGFVEPSETPKIEVVWYESGMYKVGTDIPAGEYFVMSDEYNSAYIELASDSTGEFESTIMNDIIDTFRFITVTDGQYITIDDAQFTEADNAIITQPEDGIYVEGMYRVGIDIPAGEYLVQSEDSDMGFVEVTSNSTGNFDDIITNEIVEGSIYITISDGQYIKIMDSKLYIKNK